MSVEAVYEVCCDLNRDRDFSDANEDITAYVRPDVRPFEWQTGATESFADMGRANSLTLTLSNASGRFSPEHASALAGFLPGALVRVRATDPATATVYGQFIGWIDPDGIAPIAGARGEAITTVTASGFFLRLMDEPVRVGLQVNQRADQIIDALLTRNAVYPPGFSGWFLGEQALGENTVLASGVTDYAILETGVNTFAYAGDNWDERTTIYRALVDVVQSERGFLYENRDGKLVFYNRHHWHTDLVNAVDATLVGADIQARQGMRYAYGNVVNDCLVTFHPRSVGEAIGVLGIANTAPRVEAGDSLVFRLRFDDGSGYRIGGLNVLTPVANSDWTANSFENGAGTDRTSSVSVSMIADGNAADLTFTNSAPEGVFIRNLQVRGIKVTDFGEQSIRYQDDDSVADFGRITRTLAVRILDDPNYAAAVGEQEVWLHKDPTGEVRSLRFRANDSPALMTFALSQSVGARIAFSETQTGAADTYYVIGTAHQVSARDKHEVTLYLQPAPLQTLWILGQANYGELGQITRLGV